LYRLRSRGTACWTASPLDPNDATICAYETLPVCFRIALYEDLDVCGAARLGILALRVLKRVSEQADHPDLFEQPASQGRKILGSGVEPTHDARSGGCEDSGQCLGSKPGRSGGSEPTPRSHAAIVALSRDLPDSRVVRSWAVTG
jgi:hypothetical protein